MKRLGLSRTPSGRSATSADAREERDPAGVLGDLLEGRYFVVDARGHITRWSAGAEASLGWTPNEIAGRSAFEPPFAWSGPDGERWRDYLEDTGPLPPPQASVSLLCRDGGELPATVAIVPVPLRLGYEFTVLVGDLAGAGKGSKGLDALVETHPDATGAIADALGGDWPEQLAGMLIAFHSDGAAISPADPRAADAARALRIQPETADDGLADNLPQLDALRTEVASLETRLHDAERGSQASRAEAERMAAAFKSARAEADHLAHELEEARRELDAARQEAMQPPAGEELERLTAERDELNAALEAARAEEGDRGAALAAVEAERDELTAALAAAQAERDELTAALAAAQAERDEARTTIPRLQAEGEAARARLAELEAEADTLQRRLDDAERAAAESTAEVDEARRLVAEERERAVARLREVDDALATERGRLADLRTRIDAGDAEPERDAVQAGPRLGLDDIATPRAHIGLDGHFTRLNSAFCRLVGYSEAEFRRAPWPPIADQEGLAALEELTRRVIEGELESGPVDAAYMHAQGLLVPIVGTLSAERDEAGLTSHLVLDVEPPGGA